MLCFGRPESGTFAEYSVRAQLVILGDFGVCGVEPFVIGVSVMVLWIGMDEAMEITSWFFRRLDLSTNESWMREGGSTCDSEKLCEFGIRIRIRIRIRISIRFLLL
jgi:hypothetical protein